MPPPRRRRHYVNACSLPPDLSQLSHPLHPVVHARSVLSLPLDIIQLTKCDDDLAHRFTNPRRSLDSQLAALTIVISRTPHVRIPSPKSKIRLGVWWPLCTSSRPFSVHQSHEVRVATRSVGTPAEEKLEDRPRTVDLRVWGGCKECYISACVNRALCYYSRLSSKLDTKQIIVSSYFVVVSP